MVILKLKLNFEGVEIDFIIFSFIKESFSRIAIIYKSLLISVSQIVRFDGYFNQLILITPSINKLKLKKRF